MPIPPMLASPATLPPFTGTDPAEPSERSPYMVTMEEFVTRFGTSPARRVILDGLIQYRRELRRLPFNGQFQWFAGSFVENPGREPNDVDVVTFYSLTSAEILSLIDDPVQGPLATRLMDSDAVKSDFHCDAYVVNMASERLLVFETHYWYGLFSHQRKSLAWKGMIQVELKSADDDLTGENLLASMG